MASIVHCFFHCEVNNHETEAVELVDASSQTVLDFNLKKNTA